MKLTPWFPASIKPVRAGVYETQDGGPTAWYRRWDGMNWYLGDPTPEGAAQETTALPDWITTIWRGLAEEPK